MQQQRERLSLQPATAATLKIAQITGLRWVFPLLTTLLGNLSTLRRAGKRTGDTPREYIVIISLQYGRWKLGHPNGENMQLESVKNDIKALLDHLGYRHDTADGRHWDFLMDYNLDYKDPSGTTKRLPRTGLPTKDNMLKTIQEATRRGASVHQGNPTLLCSPM